MNEREMQQLFAELIHAQGDALGVVVTALCQQVDPARLTNDLRAAIAAAKLMPEWSSVATRIATTAMAAAEAERNHQAKPPSEGPHPTRRP
jgi:predicted lysophospholipase L1 biosynthesis ABC-type transport system permease subunit